MQHKHEDQDTVAACYACHNTNDLTGGRGWRTAALHCTALHCTALHCTALHCTALHCTALHCTALHCTALHLIYLQSLLDLMCQDLTLERVGDPTGTSRNTRYRRPALNPSAPPSFFLRYSRVTATEHFPQARGHDTW